VRTPPDSRFPGGGAEQGKRRYGRVGAFAVVGDVAFFTVVGVGLPGALVVDGPAVVDVSGGPAPTKMRTGSIG
jgi:hypothetical protein